MASATTIRSPPLPEPLTEPCQFHRSRSRVFYESECTSPTSWEFRNINLDSPVPSAIHQMQLSLLRSPLPLPINELDSPIEQPDSSSVLHHRSLSSPTKDDLGGDGSDGSRNSTGSSSGSHRSQDSGFSDSGESKPSRRSANSIQGHSNNQSHVSANRSNQYNESCSQNQDPNKIYLQHQQNHSRSSPLALSPMQQSVIHEHQSQHPHNQSQSLYSQAQPHYHYLHERCYSTPVPSPIPHSGSGCGKLLRNTTYQKLQVLESKSPYSHQSHRHYGESNDSNGGCSNCVYQEIALQKPNCNSPQYENRSSRGSENFAMYSTVVSPTDQICHLGAPVCSSTPKRSNVSSTSRLTIMQKIDNFESLNKNKKLLDSNNNSNNNANSANSSSSSSSLHYINGTVVLSQHQHQNQNTRTLANNSPPNHQDHGISHVNTTAISSPEPLLSKKSPSKRYPKLSISSLSSSNHNSSSTLSATGITTDFAHHDNKTVVHRGYVPQPISSFSECSRETREDAENNNFTLNEFSTYASQSNLKACTKISPKWESLPRGYKRIPVKAGLSSSFYSEAGEDLGGSMSNPSEKLIIVKSHFDNDAMRLWLHELRSQTEPECLHMLQTKSVLDSNLSGSILSATLTTKKDHDAASDLEWNSRENKDSETNRGQGLDSINGAQITNKGSVVAAIHAISSPLMSIRNVERMANVVSGEFAKICKNIEFGFLSQVPNLVLSLVCHVEEFLKAFQGSSNFGNLQKLENKLSRSCRRLHRSAHIMIEMTSNDPGTSINGDSAQPNSIYAIIEPDNIRDRYHVAVSEVVDGIVTVGNLFSQVVDLRLTRDLSCILDTVEGGGVPAKVALKSFATVLIDGGNHLCRLASEIRTVRGLLGVILDARDDYDKILSLRCLATVLCVGEAVKDFDRAGGFEIVADFMYERMYPLSIKIEAVSVLTQATDPWIDLETSLSSLGMHLEKIVVSLTNLIRECESVGESFLLVVAAISNLTFLEVASIEILRRCNTVSLIIDAIQQTDREFSVFVLDHVATILANMAGVESCRSDIVKSGGVQALLNFLQRRPSSTESPPEIMACERVQQKSTIAISRLCTEEGVAQFILEQGGVYRLVMLSRNERDRNYSDGVLIAALATLRKLVTICGDDVVRELQAEDLIQPRLLDSFLLYSSRQESYV